MKHYVVRLPEGVFAIPYQPITESVRIEGSGWGEDEWDNEDAEWQVRDDIVQYLCDEIGVGLFDSSDISIMDNVPECSITINM